MSHEILDQSANATTFATQQAAQQELPNKGGILTLGILSIVFAGLLGVIMGIISLSMASTSIRLYRENPDYYTVSSLKTVKAGKTCSIIGICIAGLAILLLIVVLAAN